ncbi:MAG: PDZ domain-containing protein [Bacteroidales bacterium]|nr:PDZ domain-containing protein [Bacteroidales bacterium]
MKKILLSALTLVFFCAINAQDETRLMRFPAIHDNQVVFSYAGDLYTVDKTGGTARKLTNDEGYEMFARFSPDGKHIAFTAQYDGNTEVYLIPAEGGVPKRLTYTATLSRDDISDRMGPNNIVISWKDNEKIVFRSRKKSFNSFKGQLFLTDINGGLSEELPLPCGGFCSYSPDKTKLAYNRVFREFRTWKYYKGGMADDVWIYDFKTKETINITNNDVQNIIPMWHNDFIYFLSDRDKTMNLFAYNTETKETKKLTDYTEFDIKFPSLGNNSIIYENGGYIYNFDLTTQKSEKIVIKIADDFINGRSELKDVSKSIISWAVSPDGKRLVFGARGDIYTLPAKTGITKNLTETSGVHDRNVEWSPDGEYISYISDITGEDEIYIIKQDGSSEPVQLTNNSDTYKYNPVWSPDSKKLLWSDKMQRLQYLDIKTKKIILVDESRDGEFYNYTWSPDSKWIAYPRPDKTSKTKIYIYNLSSNERQPVTAGWYSSGSPAFSNDGKYLFFTSLRDFNPIYSWTEWNHAYQDMSKIYFVTLTKKTLNPLKPDNDEVKINNKNNEGKSGKKEKDNNDKSKEKLDVKIDFDGIISRIVALPVKAGSYWNINPVGDCVYYGKRSRSDEKACLMMYNLKNKKEKKLGDYGSFIISSDHKEMAISTNGKYAIIDLPKAKISIEDYVNLSNMKMWIDLKEEWQEIYDESWRQMRDFFYDPNMHGVDWQVIYEKYNPLVPYVNNRNDLNYIIGEMIGELSTGHAYVSGGDKPSPKRIKTGLLGAELSKDKSGYYKIDKILKGENWTDNTRSPLTEVGVDINEGDYIIAVNGKPTNEMIDIYASLVNTAGQQLELTINDKPTEKNSKKIIIIPIADESNLYYYNWVQNNIEKVNHATDGQIGYIHIPDMSAEGLNEFVKYYYPQLSKRGLIIDNRGNGGGNVSPMIIERLNRELTLMGMGRDRSQSTNPKGMVYGPKILLLDRYSASDGDLFPYQFKKLGIGKTIGVRSWGGVVGIRGSLPIIDGGILYKPEFAHYDTEGKKFIIEGYGVDPDIVIDNDPAKEYAGEDEQLNKAIEVILEELKNYPDGLPPIPPFPDKKE